MKLLKKILKKQKNLRGDQRGEAPADIACQIGRAGLQTAVPVKILDISNGGMAILIREDKFDVGQAIQITFHLKGRRQVTYEGEILSQLVVYPGKVENLQSADYRFSVRFKDKVEADLFNKVREFLESDHDTLSA